VSDAAVLLVVPILGATLFFLAPCLEQWLDRDQAVEDRRPS
jgi:hypothetical protein